MKRLLLALALLLCGCKKEPSAAAPPTQAANVNVDVFARTADQVLIKVEAIRTDCPNLLSEAVIQVLAKMDDRMICGEMSFSADTTRQLISSGFGGNQATPWSGDSNMTSGIFAIEDNVLMMAVVLEPENTLVLLGK